MTFFAVTKSFEICIDHGSDAVVLCAIFQNDWSTETDFMEERYFAGFEFKMRFRRISYIAQPPGHKH